MIKLQIVGNLGKDCIVNNVNGKNVMNFSVANTEKFKDSQGNPKERTTWVECAYWSDRTAVAEYLKKGTLVYAEGSPEADAYTNRENQPAATLRMRVLSLQLLGGKDNNSGGGSSNYANNSNTESNNYTKNDVSNVGGSPRPAMKSEAAPSGIEETDDLPF